MHITKSNSIAVIFIAIGIAFGVQLFLVQVVDDTYHAAAAKNIVATIEEVPCRGIIYDRKGDILVANDPIYDLMVVPKAIKNLDISAFCKTFSITPDVFQKQLEKAKQYSRVRSSVFIKGITQQMWANIQEKLIDYIGFYVKPRSIRQYMSPILSHTVGYLAEISPQRLQVDSLGIYRKGDLIGMSGLESSYEFHLRGRRGITYKITDVRGREQGPFQGGKLDIPAIPGKNLYITIDRSLQAYGEKLMENKVGSIIAVEPATGEILAIISSPGYDPMLLTSTNLKTQYPLLEKASLAPLFHRPIMAMYAPGSIFKTVQALIALQEQVITPHTQFSCNRNILKCRNHPSPLNLHQAIQYSCNPYFFYVFNHITRQHISEDIYEDSRIGLVKWIAYVHQFGLGKPLGIDLPHEKGGFIPHPAFYDRKYGANRWKTSTIRSLDIGQGEMLATPLQMVNLIAILANRGYYYTPHVVKSIDREPTAVNRYEVGIDKKHFEMVALAMQDAIQQGSGRRAYIENVSMAGKTGTVQNPHGEDHAVFMVFAPFEQPQIALVVYVENSGWGGRSAAAIGGLLLEKYFTGEVKRKEMETYVLEGNFLD